MFIFLTKFNSFVEKQKGCYVKTLRSDKGKEFTLCQFEKFHQDEGVER